MISSPRPPSIDWKLQWQLARSESLDWNTKHLLLERETQSLRQEAAATAAALHQAGIESITELQQHLRASATRITSLESELSTQLESRDVDRAALEQQQELGQEMHEIMVAEQTAAASLRQELQELQEVAEASAAAADKLRATASDLKLELQTSQQLAAQSMERAKALNTALSQQHDEFMLVVQKTAEEIEALRVQLALAETEREEALGQKHLAQQHLQHQRHEYEILEVEADQCRQDAADLGAATGHLEARNADLQLYINELETKIDAAQATQGALAQAELGLKTLEARLEEISATKEILEQDLLGAHEEHQCTKKSAEMLGAENARLCEEIGEKTTTVSDLRARALESETQRLELAGELEARTKELAEMQETLESANGEHAARHESLRAHTLELESQVAQLSGALEARDKEYRLQLKRIDSERDASSEAAAQIEELQSLLATEQEQSQRSRQQMAETEGIVNEKMSIIGQLRNEIEVQRSVINDQKLRIETHENAKMIEKDHIRQNEQLRRQANLSRLAEQEAQGRLELESRLRRQLQERLLELKGTIRVFCRVRPILGSEMFREGSLLLDPLTSSVSVSQSINGFNSSHPRVSTFQFDQVFDGGSTNADIFKEVDLLIQSIFNGFSCCIFAYGQTGSGKSHTMLSEDGIVYSTIKNIFEVIKITDHSTAYSLHVSFFEIYNEQVKDITNIAGSASPSQGVLRGVQEHPVQSTEGLVSILEAGLRNRAVGATQMNQDSSRSHTIYSIRIEGVDRRTGAITSGKLNLIDLAGSERLEKSQVTGVQLKETQAINKSLSALGDVINALGTRAKSHIPFRNSKLTHMLQDSLSGKSKTLMLVNISPALSSLQETLTSLRFAEKVNSTKLRRAD